MSRQILFKGILPKWLVSWVICTAFGLTYSAVGYAAEADKNLDFCAGCHEDAPMLGVHSGKRYGPTNMVAACIDCHGIVTDVTVHEKDASDVFRFNNDTEIEPFALNDRCMACHNPLELRAAHWTHDAHGNDLSCTSCHDLHSAHDPIRGISKKTSIQLCVNCHSEQTLAGEGAKQ